MRILLDGCVPRALGRELTGADVYTVQECGWAGTRNGELLRRVLADGFTAFITTGRNLEYQQNLAASGLAVIVLVARTNRLADLLPLVLSLREALTAQLIGQVTHVSADG